MEVTSNKSIALDCLVTFRNVKEINFLYVHYWTDC